ncbi:hypothetical protein [Kitasatospora nipponensis]
MADLERKRNEELARILHQLAWSPERLAREVNLLLPQALAISKTAPYKWRDRGMVPRAPHDQTVCEVLSRAVGIAVTYQQLWGRMGSHRGARVLSALLLTDAWDADTAQLALREAAADAVPVRLTDLFRGDALARVASHWAEPAPAVTGGEGALRIAPSQLSDLRLGHDSKRRLERSCGGGLVLAPARAELAMAGKLLELGSYAFDERLGRGLYGEAARLAHLVGRANDDLGHEAAAQRAFVAALRAAQLSGDLRLGAGILGSLVVQITHHSAHTAGRGADPVALLDIGLAAADGLLTPRQRARQLGRSALAHGWQGDRAGVEAASTRAFALLEQQGAGEAGDGGAGGGDAAGDSGAVGADAGGAGAGGGVRADDRAELAGLVGEGYLFLDDHGRARPLLIRAVRELSAERARDRALLMVRLADSYRRTGEREQAARTADQARRLAAGMQSGRVARALRDIDAALREVDAAQRPA